MSMNVPNVGNYPSTGIGANYNKPDGNPQKDVKEELQPQSQGSQESLVSADDALGFLAATGAYNNVQVNNKPEVSSAKVIDISKYVTPEQAQRIAGFVTGFDSEIAEYLNVAAEEGLPEEAAYAAFEKVNY